MTEPPLQVQIPDTLNHEERKEQQEYKHETKSKQPTQGGRWVSRTEGLKLTKARLKVQQKIAKQKSTKGTESQEIVLRPFRGLTRRVTAQKSTVH